MATAGINHLGSVTTAHTLEHVAHNSQLNVVSRDLEWIAFAFKQKIANSDCLIRQDFSCLKRLFF